MITVGYIKQNLNHLDDDLLVYSSDYTREYTIELFNNGYISMFNPITEFYYEGSLTANFSFSNKSIPTTLGELHAAIDQHYLSDNIEFERDVEDGFVFEAYKHCFYDDKVIVFA